MIPQNRQNRYELRNNANFTLLLIILIHKDPENFLYLGPKIWEILPVEIKQTVSTLKFKVKI